MATLNFILQLHISKHSEGSHQDKVSGQKEEVEEDHDDSHSSGGSQGREVQSEYYDQNILLK